MRPPKRDQELTERIMQRFIKDGAPLHVIAEEFGMNYINISHYISDGFRIIRQNEHRLRWVRAELHAHSLITDSFHPKSAFSDDESDYGFAIDFDEHYRNFNFKHRL